MGQKDIHEKILVAYNDVFADIVNVLLLGQDYIKPEELEDGPTESFYKAEDGKSHSQLRDVMKFYKNGGIIIAAMGIENQSQETDDMPVRVMGYDYANLRKQMDESGNTVYPAITIVLNFSEKRWSKPRSLKEMYGEIPSVLEPFVQDYRIFVFDVAFLPEETREKFTSDFKVVADLFATAESKGKRSSLKHFDSVVELLEVFAGEEFAMEVKRKYEGGGVAMFDIAGKYEAKGAARGKAEGKAEGIIKTCERFNKSKDEILAVMTDELSVTIEEAQRLYEEYKARECALV